MREGQRSSINEKCAGNAAHILIIMTSNYSALRRQHYLPQVIIGEATIVCSDSSEIVHEGMIVLVLHGSVVGWRLLLKKVSSLLEGLKPFCRVLSLLSMPRIGFVGDLGPWHATIDNLAMVTHLNHKMVHPL